MEQSLLLLVLSLCSVSVCQNYSYHFINENKTWSEARQYCREHYTDLATVYNQTDADTICGNVTCCPGAAGAWIGLHQQNSTNRSWHWSQPGLEFSHSQEKWGNKQPNYNHDQKEEGCVYVQNQHWHDADCEGKQGFICYNSSTNSSVTFKKSSDKKSWLEALQFCRENHTDLISGLQDVPDTNTCPICWIGLFRDSWYWSDGSKSSFRNWDEKETVLDNDWNPPNQQCARLGEQKKWMSGNCTEEHPFICYDNHMILIRENKSWEEALYYCRQNHHDLAVMTNKHLQRMVQERANVADTAHVWVGLHYTCMFKTWLWIDGQFVYDGNWDKGEPHKCGLAGAVAKGGGNKWWGKSAGDEYNFVCSVSC